MNYITIKEAAQKWGISDRQVQLLCKKGAVKGAEKFGRSWMIPENASKPADGRTKDGKSEQEKLLSSDMPLPRKTPFLYMTDLYNAAGCAEESVAALSSNHEAQVLLEAEIAYSRGEIDKVYESANYLLSKHSGFYAVLSAGVLLALCAIWRGDLNMWRRAKLHIANARAKDDRERDIISLSITAVDCVLYDAYAFPEWFKMGCFEPLHKDSLPAAYVYYARYLYCCGYVVATKQLEVEGVRGLSLMSMIPNTIEPLISQAIADNYVIAEIHLRMTCAAVYHNCGNDEQAIRHIDRAVALAKPDKLYGMIAEYIRILDTLPEKYIGSIDQEMWQEIKALYTVYNKGWTKLSGAVRGKNLVLTLSAREREVAKLAAYGMQNSEIAQKLSMSLSGVKQAIRIVSEKTGMRRDEFAAIL